MNNEGSTTKTGDTNNAESRRALRNLALGFLGAVCAALVFSIFSIGPVRSPVVFSISLLILGTSALCGGLVGFVFGIPRSFQSNDPNVAPLTTPLPTTENKAQISTTQLLDSTGNGYIANTNLEQISDWLTKILVGVGLTQINDIPSGIGRLVSAIGPAFGEASYIKSYVTSILAFGVLLGFLFGYLWTRLFLIGALRYADGIGILAAKAEAAEREVDQLKKQSLVDANALSVVERQLSASPDSPAPTDVELRMAVSGASKSVLVQIFYRARDLRSRTWSDSGSKHLMELTIPVFRALIASDSQRKYHQNHGQLAYALKDKIGPDYIEAEREFATAINIRDRNGQSGLGLYELCRAICVIKRDVNFLASPTPALSDEKTKRIVVADLRQALADPHVWKIANQDEDLVRWCEINGVSLESLKTQLSS